MSGKLKKNYNSIKPTKRQQKKQVAKEKEAVDLNQMVQYLESKWKNKVTFSCSHCLTEAYTSVMNDTNGYVTDEELIKSSNNTLKHK